MSDLHAACPWCGASDFDNPDSYQIRENGKVWMGTKYGAPVSVSVYHWCPRPDGQPQRAIERVGRDRESAVAAWNQRHGEGER